MGCCEAWQYFNETTTSCQSIQDSHTAEFRKGDWFILNIFQYRDSFQILDNLADQKYRLRPTVCSPEGNTILTRVENFTVKSGILYSENLLVESGGYCLDRYQFGSNLNQSWTVSCIFQGSGIHMFGNYWHKTRGYNEDIRGIYWTCV